MDPLIFKTDTNLTDVDTINSFTRSLIKGDDSVDTYSPDSSFLFLVLLPVLGFFFLCAAVKIAAVLTKAINKKDVKPKEARIAVLALAGIVAVLVFSVSVKAGPEGKFGMESVMAYYDKDKATVKEIQGSWLYKNHDFVQKNVKNSSYLKGFDIHCEDEMKIPEQEKRSVLCGGDVLSPVAAKTKEFGTEYWLLPDFRKYLDDGHRESDPRIAKLKKQEKDEENPIKLSMIIKETSV